MQTIDFQFVLSRHLVFFVAVLHVLPSALYFSLFGLLAVVVHLLALLVVEREVCSGSPTAWRNGDHQEAA